MAFIITVASLKGGVGKSTVAVNLATCLHQAKHAVLLVDCDPQSSCATWAAHAAEAGIDGLPVVAIEGRALRRSLTAVAAGFDVVVIDTPPRLATEARAAMLAADVVVVPITPGGADMWALKSTLDALEEVKSLRSEIRAVVLANRMAKTNIAKLARQALHEMDAKVLDTVLGNRVAFGEATLAGLGVVDYAPKSVAAREVKAMTAEVLAAVEG